MPLFGLDVHPQYQRGLNIEQAVREGVAFFSVKVSQGTDSSYLAGGSTDWVRRARTCGCIALGYHYLTVDVPMVAQAAVFARALAMLGIPGVLDAEYPTPDGDTHTATNIKAFLAAAAGYGAHIPLMYLPRWYWERMGSPLMAGCPPLWASAYASRAVAPPAALYPAVHPGAWLGYAGLPVAVLQYADTGMAGGISPVDVNAFEGTLAQFARLVGAGAQHSRKDRQVVIRLPATDPPKDLNSDPSTWPQRNWDVPFDLVGGWEGDCALSFGGQDWAGRTVDSVRSFLLIASWVMSGGVLQPVEPVYTVAGKGRAINAHAQLPTWVAPKGAIGVTVNYAAPGEAYFSMGRSG